MSKRQTTRRRARKAARCGAKALLALLVVGGPALPVPARSDPGPALQIRYDTPGPVPLLQADYRREVAASIVVTRDRLNPVRTVIRAGESVEWTSRARTPVRIVFEREVARSMVCHRLVHFEIEDDELRSAPLQVGDVASFCELQPGIYRYRVESDEQVARARPLSERLHGVLEVRPRP